MAGVGLQYELDIDFARAKRQLDDFRRDAAGKLAKSVQSAVDAGLGGQGGLSEKVVRNRIKLLATIQRAEAKGVEESIRDYVAGERQKARTTVDRIRTQWSQTKARLKEEESMWSSLEKGDERRAKNVEKQEDAAWRAHESAEERKTKTTEREVDKRTRKEKRAMEDEENARRRTRSILSTVRANYTGAGGAFGPAYDSAAKKSTKEVLEAEQHRAFIEDKFAAARSLAQRDEGITLQVHTERLKSIREAYLLDVAQLESRIGQMGLAELQQELSNRTQAYGRHVRELRSLQASDINTANVSNSGRNFQRFFQGQQLVEDAAIGMQLNGLSGALRGASNNISFLGASIEGPTGIAVLLAGLGLTLANTAGLFDKFGESAKRAKEEMEEYGRTREHLLGLEEKFLGRERSSRASDGLHEEIRLIRQRTDAKQRELDLQRENIALLQRLPVLESGMSGVGTSPGQFISQGEITGRAVRGQQADAIRRLLTSRGVNPEGDVQFLEERFKGLQSELRGLNRESVEATTALDELNKTVLGPDAKAREANERLGGLSSKSEAIQKRLDDGRKALAAVERRRDTSQQLSDIRERINLFRPEGPQENMEKYAKALADQRSLLSRYADEMDKVSQTTADQVEWANEMLVAGEKLRDVRMEQLDIYQREADTARSLVDRENERLEVIKEQRRVQREGFERDVFGARNTIISQRAGENLDVLSRQAGSARDAIQSRREQLFSRLDTMGRAGANSRYISGVKAQIDAEAQYRLKAIDAEEERRRKSIEQTRDQQIRAATRDRERLLGGRATSFADQARAAFDAGQFDRARELNEMARQNLSELQNLQMGQIGQGTANDSQAALARAEETQRKLDATFGMDAQATTSARDEALNNYRSIVAEATKLASVMQQSAEYMERVANGAQVSANALRQIRESLGFEETRTSRLQTLADATGSAGDRNLFARGLEGQLRTSQPIPQQGLGSTQSISTFAPNVTINGAGGATAGILAELQFQQEIAKRRTNR